MLLCFEGEVEVVVVGVPFGGVLPLVHFAAQVISSRLSVRVLLVKNCGLRRVCRKLNDAVLDKIRESRRIRGDGGDRPLAQDANHTACTKVLKKENLPRRQIHNASVRSVEDKHVAIGADAGERALHRAAIDDYSIFVP